MVSCFKFPVDSCCSRIRFKFIVNIARLVPTDANLALQPKFSPAFPYVFDSQATESLIPLKGIFHDPGLSPHDPLCLGCSFLCSYFLFIFQDQFQMPAPLKIVYSCIIIVMNRFIQYLCASLNSLPTTGCRQF